MSANGYVIRRCGVGGWMRLIAWIAAGVIAYGLLQDAAVPAGLGLPVGPAVHGRMTPRQLYRLARNERLPPGAAVTAVAVALAESGGRVAAVSPPNRDGTVDRCAWQVNSAHRQYAPGRLVRDPRYCARAMAELSGRGRTWRPWTTYNSGAYRQFLPVARRAARA